MTTFLRWTILLKNKAVSMNFGVLQNLT